VWLCIHSWEVERIHCATCEKVMWFYTLGKSTSNADPLGNHRHSLDWIVGFTRSSCNFSKVVDSIPAFIEETFFRPRRLIDLVQCIGKSLHPDVFNHSNVLLIHTQTSQKQVSMQQCSRSVSSRALGIRLPECPDCKDDRFMTSKVHQSGVDIKCIGCCVRALRVPITPTLLFLKLGLGLFSVLPYPPLVLSDRLKIEWPTAKIKTPKPQLKPGKKQAPNKDFIYGMVHRDFLLCCHRQSNILSVLQLLWRHWYNDPLLISWLHIC
jgi:hypothetical protein